MTLKLHYNRFRYHDSDVGMFIQRDPIGFLVGVNVFAYAPNPIHWIDPLGLCGNKSANQRKVEIKEKSITDYLESLGRKVEDNPLEGGMGEGRQADKLVDGVKTEFKTLDAGKVDNLTVIGKDYFYTRVIK